MAFVNTFGPAQPIAPFGNGCSKMRTIRMGEDAGCSRRSLRLRGAGWETGKRELIEEFRAKAAAMGLALDELLGSPARAGRPAGKAEFLHHRQGGQLVVLRAGDVELAWTSPVEWKLR
jgi:hypothetical protein